MVGSIPLASMGQGVAQFDEAGIGTRARRPGPPLECPALGPPGPMQTRPTLLPLGLGEFTDRLAERTPTPGGGSMAAYLAASGAALTAMAFRFTSGEKYAAVEAAMASRVEALEGLRRPALELVDRDSAAYDAVTAAYRLPKSSDAEKSARAEAVQQGLRTALEVPLETLRTARQALAIAGAGAADVNKNLASDCATGSWCL